MIFVLGPVGPPESENNKHSSQSGQDCLPNLKNIDFLQYLSICDCSIAVMY